jgi:hypothetical protein
MKPNASISLDLDNKWAYLKAHGNPAWESYPSYLPKIVPRILDFLNERDLQITFFVVGQDAEHEVNHPALRAISDAGHEIANHSFNHEPWLHLYEPEVLEEEFERTENNILKTTGQTPVGFRGPGFSLSDEVLRTLMRRGYVYDGTSFPTFLGPVARAVYFLTSGLSREQKEERKELFGRFTDGLKTLSPYRFAWRGKDIIELPVTTMPVFKLPIHGSYLMFLGKFSTTLAKFYFWFALKMCRLTGVEPHMLLHPLDFMGHEDDSALAFFPGMDQPRAKKVQLMSDCLAMMQKEFNVLCMKDHVQAVRREELPLSTVSAVPQGVAVDLAKPSA